MNLKYEGQTPHDHLNRYRKTFDKTSYSFMIKNSQHTKNRREFLQSVDVVMLSEFSKFTAVI